MTEHAGVGCFLSVLIVVAFTLVFHEVERPNLARSPAEPPRAATGPAMTQRASPVADPPRLDSQARIDPVPVVTQSRPAIAPETSSGPAFQDKAVDVAAPTGWLVSTRSSARSVSQPLSAPEQPRPVPPLTASERPDARVSHPSPGSVAPPRDSSVKRSRNGPRSSTTITLKGEQLVDVAIRVYGTAEATIQIWRANRDRLASVDSPVSEGWLLRTP